MLEPDFPDLLFLEPRTLLHIGVELDLVCDLIRFADFMVVLYDFAAWGVECGPVRILLEAEAVKNGRDVAKEAESACAFVG